MNGRTWRWSLLWRFYLVAGAAAAGGLALGCELGLFLGKGSQAVRGSGSTEAPSAPGAGLAAARAPGDPGYCRGAVVRKPRTSDIRGVM